MKKIAIGVLLAAASIFMALGLMVTAARSGWLTPSETQMRARYALPGSKFVTLSGAPIHYTDEGQGFPVVLVHGSFGSLLMWNDWAKLLAKHFRVIRFDRPTEGLSGSNTRGEHDAVGEVRVIEGLTHQLGVKRFYLAATSSGGEAGAAYAAQHPDQVRGLILSNIAVGVLKPDLSRFSPRFKLLLQIQPLFKGWRPRLFWREVLTSNFANPKLVTSDLVAQWTDLNNRAQRMPKAAFDPKAPLPFERTPGDLAKITAPTLLIWSDKDAEVPLNPVGIRALSLLASTDKQLLVVKGCGHMIALECGPQSALLANAFFERLNRQGR